MNEVTEILEIEDDGPGTPFEDCEKVFYRFYQLHGSADVSCCYLGLPIVR